MDQRAVLGDIVQRILSVHPHARIILFGSRALEAARPDSDFDLLIVAPDLSPGEPPSARIRRALRGLGRSFDLVVVTPEEWATMRRVRGSVVRVASETGRVLHEAA